MSSEYETTCQATGIWTPNYICEREGHCLFVPPVNVLFFYTVFSNIWSFFPHIFSHVAVDCGNPDIPKDGILHLVGSENPNTKYNAEIHVNCSSNYYKLEGDGDYRKLVCSPFLILWLK